MTGANGYLKLFRYNSASGEVKAYPDFTWLVNTLPGDKDQYIAHHFYGAMPGPDEELITSAGIFCKGRKCSGGGNTCRPCGVEFGEESSLL